MNNITLQMIKESLHHVFFHMGFDVIILLMLTVVVLYKVLKYGDKLSKKYDK